jgi:CO dehydrogenase maturation factor
MIITVAGKGGVGKTTIAALLLDEIARAYPGLHTLAVDADPSTTLHLALGFPEPKATVADVRDEVVLDRGTLRSLPPGQSRASFVVGQLRCRGVIATGNLRRMELDLLAMGRGEGKGCYCAVNNALAAALAEIVDGYDLVLVDAPAGMEHLNRYVLPAVDLFLVVTTPAPAARAVARRVMQAVDGVGMAAAQRGTVLNRADVGRDRDVSPDGDGLPPPWAVVYDDVVWLPQLERQGRPVVALYDDSPARAALRAALQMLGLREREAVCA